MSDPIAESPQQAYARFAGFMYLFVLAFDIAGLVIVNTITGDGSFLERSERITASQTLYALASAGLLSAACLRYCSQSASMRP
jgi:hypothetical protein